MNELYNNFIDYKQAFDSVWQEGLWRVMRYCGVPEELVTLIEDLSQSALEFCPIHCPNGRLGQDLVFGGSAFALNLPELLNRNLVAVRAKLGQTSCFPNGPQIWCQIGQ